jgi:hypothetical protein
MYNISQPTKFIVTNEADKSYRCEPNEAGPFRVGWQLPCTSQRRTESMCVVRLTSLLLLAHWLGYGPQHLKGGVSDVPHLSAVPQPTIQRTHHWVTSLYYCLCVKLQLLIL